MIRLSRLLEGSVLVKNSFCNPVCKRTIGNVSGRHIYNKNWNIDKVFQYMRNNVVYECDQYYVTSLPPGIALKKDVDLCDSESSFVSDVTIQDIKRQLRLEFEPNRCQVAVHPRRNASGLTIFTKNRNAWACLVESISRANAEGILAFTFLAVVMGDPSQTLKQKLAVKPVEKPDGFTLELKDLSIATKKCKIVEYEHEVLCSREGFSLLKVKVSNEKYDLLRHILAVRSSTPVLGDFWNCRRREGVMFGVPLVRDVSVCSTAPNILDSEILEKLNLQSSEEKFIPPHIHFYSITLQLKKNLDLFFSVPPPDYFVWTCKQLGLDAIEKFSHLENEKSEMTVA